ncbi:MAG: 30S ribosomal protein S8 [Parcubacteria group bacterium SW_6_46_9]|nr:MAG: 30S ribosomal protein S8 [Parcubacteria group bacterium SW_6_46_9]
MVEDPVGDMLARIENGAAAKKLSVTVPFSNLRANIADVLKDLGFIADFDVDEDEHEITIKPAYTDDGESKIRHTRRISRPARRRYVSHDEIPDVRGDYGAVILSTPEGVLTGEKSRQQHVGGELLFEIW